MTEKGSFSRRTLNAMHVGLLAGVVVLLALIAYNYAQSGKVSSTSLLVAVVLLVIVFTQRAAFAKKGGGGE